MNIKNLRRYIIAAAAATLLLTTACQRSTLSKARQEALRDSVEEMIHQGKRLREAADFMNAVDLHRKALQKAIEIRDTLHIIQAYNNLGTDMRRMGMLNEALTSHYEALRYCELTAADTSFRSRKNMVVTLNGIGNIQMSLGDHANAEHVFRRALAGEQLLKSDLGMAINYANLGSIKEQAGDIDSALVLYQKSLEHNTRAGSQLGISLCHNHFGRIAENRGDYAAALKEYTQSYDVMSKSQDKWHWLESVLAIARINLALHNREEARRYLDEAYATASSIKAREHLADIYRLRSQYDEMCGNTAQALAHFKRGTALEDSILNEKNIDKLQTMRINYERRHARKDYEEMRLSFENEQRQKHIILVSGIIILLMAIAAIAFLVYAHRMRLRSSRSQRELERMRTAFFTNITHEFRTPVTIITGLIHQLREGKVDRSDMPTTLNAIEQQGNQLLALINQLLDISRLMTHRHEDERWVHGDIIAYITMTTESYSRYAALKGITLGFSHATDSLQMDFVEDYFSNILRNLISNAVKFTPDGGKIDITLTSDTRQMTLAVSDTGSGFAEEDLPFVFNMFYQGKGEQQATGQGTGIGLSYVRQMVEHMGGTIEAANIPEGGARITLSMPLVHSGVEKQAWNPEKSTAAAPLFVESTTEIPDNDSLDEDKKTILVAEDNNDIANYMNLLLKEPYNILFAKDGQEALALAEEYSPDLLITDVMMPVMDGYELCRRIRESEDLNHLPIIMVTARTRQEDRLEGYDAGADAYLTKPFAAEELHLHIRNLLEQRRRIQEKFRKELEMELANQKTDEEEAEGGVKVSEEDQRFVDSLRKSILERLNDKDFSTASLASDMCISYSQLNRRLKNITGYSIGSYITQIRLEKAKNLIATTVLPINEIALSCGFEDSSYFARLFKQAFGDTPTQFRNRVTQES